jgi:hypothetical protein
LLQIIKNVFIQATYPGKQAFSRKNLERGPCLFTSGNNQQNLRTIALKLMKPSTMPGLFASPVGYMHRRARLQTGINHKPQERQ